MYSVYECYDPAGALLYVGVTGDLPKRMRTHKASSAWYDQITRVEVTPFADPYAAADREQQRIRDGGPRHNRERSGVPSGTWARKMRAGRDLRLGDQVTVLVRRLHWLGVQPGDLIGDGPDPRAAAPVEGTREGR